MTGPRNCTPRGGCHVPRCAPDNRRTKLVTSRRGYRCRLRHLESCRCSAPPRSAREQGHLPGVSLSSTWLWPLMAGQSGQTRDRSSRPGRGDAPELVSQEPVLCSGVAVVVALGGRAFSLALQEACLASCLSAPYPAEDLPRPRFIPAGLPHPLPARQVKFTSGSVALKAARPAGGQGDGAGIGHAWGSGWGPPGCKAEPQGPSCPPPRPARPQPCSASGVRAFDISLGIWAAGAPAGGWLGRQQPGRGGAGEGGGRAGGDGPEAGGREGAEEAEPRSGP